MQNILNYINQIPPEYFFLGLFTFMLVTCMGLIPSHTDLVLLASAIIASNGKFNFFAVMSVITIALLIGENSMFLIGYKFGKRIFNFSFFARIMPEAKREIFRKGFLQYPNRFLLALRMSPVFRPYIYLSVGSLGLSHSTFFKYHLKWTLIYIICVYTICYYGSKLFINQFNTPPIYTLVAAVIVWILALNWVRKGIGKAAQTLPKN
jgi:membrane protein DedA with SNARE-associated domain